MSTTAHHPAGERRRPTHRLKALNKATNWSCHLGVGWQAEDGSIAVVLNPCVVLDWRDYRDGVVCTLFPITDTEGRQ